MTTPPTALFSRLLCGLISSMIAMSISAQTTILEESFDGEATVLDGILEKTTSSITTEYPFSGGQCLRMDNRDDGKFSLYYDLDGEYDELYARFMFRVGNADSACWNSSQHYKLMGFTGGTNECRGGDYVSDGTDCFSVRTRFNWPYYGIHIEGFLGETSSPGKLDHLNKSVNVADGEWHCFEFQLRLNTPRPAGTDPDEIDGEVRCWVDGNESVAENLHFRTVSTLKIEKWWFTHWANDDWCGPLFVDDLVIQGNPIGCPGEAPENLPPAPPTNLRVVR